MTTKKPESVPAAAGQLKHNPFSQLAKHAAMAATPAASKDANVVMRPKPNKPAPRAKVGMRLESVGRAGKVVTRITGLPEANVAAIAQRLRKALGCSATIDAADVILHGSLQERAQAWLDIAGDLQTIVDAPVKPPIQESSAGVAAHAPSAATSPLQANGTLRSDVYRGRRVAIVLKADQDTGKLTQGVVRDVLTNSVVHPRGIKVRLESGEVGRVQVIYA
jgi:uncharacterized repeat protein (TIGR03833 family)